MKTKNFYKVTVSALRRLSEMVATVIALCCFIVQPSFAEVINDDLVVQGSACVGDDCTAQELFGFDTVRLRGENPRLDFLDTSSSGSFPSNDWSVRAEYNTTTGAPQFVIYDETGSAGMLVLQAGSDGGVALGANSEISAGAISVGSTAVQRRIAFVANGTVATDAATKSQLDAFIATISGSEATQLAQDKAALDTEINNLETQLAAILNRISTLETALSN